MFSFIHIILGLKSIVLGIWEVLVEVLRLGLRVQKFGIGGKPKSLDLRASGVQGLKVDESALSEVRAETFNGSRRNDFVFCVFIFFLLFVHSDFIFSVHVFIHLFLYFSAIIVAIIYFLLFLLPLVSRSSNGEATVVEIVTVLGIVFVLVRAREIGLVGEYRIGIEVGIVGGYRKPNF